MLQQMNIMVRVLVNVAYTQSELICTYIMLLAIFYQELIRLSYEFLAILNTNPIFMKSKTFYVHEEWHLLCFLFYLYDKSKECTNIFI